MFQEKSQFQARSGRTIKVGEDGTLIFDHVHGYLDPDSAMDAEEYHQAKRDAELGRWRYPLDPDFVVHAEGDRIAVVNERDGFIVNYTRGDAVVPESPRQIAAHKVRVAYFEAHPERKPWEDAQDGDIWALTGAGGLEQPWRRMNGVWRSIGTEGRDRVYDAVLATAGRKIWPQDAA